MDKERHESLAENARQIIGFGFVGVINNIISLAVYYIIIACNRDWYLAGNVLGFLISTLNAWMMNSRFVFRAGRKPESRRAAFFRTYIAYIISLGMSTGLLYIFVQRLNIDTRLAPVGCLMVTIPFNFLMNKLWVYKGREDS